jgi:hypothetical protein
MTDAPLPVVVRCAPATHCVVGFAATGAAAGAAGTGWVLRVMAPDARCYTAAVPAAADADPAEMGAALRACDVALLPADDAADLHLAPTASAGPVRRPGPWAAPAAQVSFVG